MRAALREIMSDSDGWYLDPDGKGAQVRSFISELLGSEGLAAKPLLKNGHRA